VSLEEVYPITLLFKPECSFLSFAEAGNTRPDKHIANNSPKPSLRVVLVSCYDSSFSKKLITRSVSQNRDQLNDLIESGA
jgi:hypothetical protein